MSRGANYVKMARKENLTLQQAMTRASLSNAHLTSKGTPASIADTLETWFNKGAADGFNQLCPTLPDALDDFIDLALPELRRRGSFRTEYEDETHREKSKYSSDMNLLIGGHKIPSVASLINKMSASLKCEARGAAYGERATT